MDKRHCNHQVGASRSTPHRLGRTTRHGGTLVTLLVVVANHRPYYCAAVACWANVVREPARRNQCLNQSEANCPWA